MKRITISSELIRPEHLESKFFSIAPDDLNLSVVYTPEGLFFSDEDGELILPEELHVDEYSIELSYNRCDVVKAIGDFLRPIKDEFLTITLNDKSEWVFKHHPLYIENNGGGIIYNDLGCISGSYSNTSKQKRVNETNLLPPEDMHRISYWTLVESIRKASGSEIYELLNRGNGAIAKNYLEGD